MQVAVAEMTPEAGPAAQHLRNGFAKLGIHSRRELSSALPKSDVHLVAV